VTFSTAASPGPADASKHDAPTLDRVLGRPALSPRDPFGLIAALAYLHQSSPESVDPFSTSDAPESELEQEESADRIMRAQAMIAEAAIKSGQTSPRS